MSIYARYKSEEDYNQRTLENLKLDVEKRDRLLRLYEDEDFIELIMEGFMVKEAARYVHASTNPSLSPEIREESLRSAQAAGYLIQYFDSIENRGERAAQTLEENSHELRGIHKFDPLGGRNEI